MKHCDNLYIKQNDQEQPVTLSDFQKLTGKSFISNASPYPKSLMRKGSEGWEILAGETIQPGTIISHYLGDEIPDKNNISNDKKDYFLMGDNHIIPDIDAMQNCNTSALVNHGPPNTMLVTDFSIQRNALVATREIKKHERILYYYSPKYDYMAWKTINCYSDELREGMRRVRDILNKYQDNYQDFLNIAEQNNHILANYFCTLTPLTEEDKEMVWDGIYCVSFLDYFFCHPGLELAILSSLASKDVLTLQDFSKFWELYSHCKQMNIEMFSRFMFNRSLLYIQKILPPEIDETMVFQIFLDEMGEACFSNRNTYTDSMLGLYLPFLSIMMRLSTKDFENLQQVITMYKTAVTPTQEDGSVYVNIPKSFIFQYQHDIQTLLNPIFSEFTQPKKPEKMLALMDECVKKVLRSNIPQSDKPASICGKNLHFLITGIEQCHYLSLQENLVRAFGKNGFTLKNLPSALIVDVCKHPIISLIANKCQAIAQNTSSLSKSKNGLMSQRASLTGRMKQNGKALGAQKPSHIG